MSHNTTLSDTNSHGYFCQGVRTNGRPCGSRISEERWVRYKVQYCFYHEDQATETTVPLAEYQALEAQLADTKDQLADTATRLADTETRLEQQKDRMAATDEHCDQLVDQLEGAREENQGLRRLVLEVGGANKKLAKLNQKQKNQHSLNEQRHQTQHVAAQEKMREDHAAAEQKTKEEFAATEKRLSDQHHAELMALRQEMDALRTENQMRRYVCDRLQETNDRLVRDLTNTRSALADAEKNVAQQAESNSEVDEVCSKMSEASIATEADDLAEASDTTNA
ncbi:hypothetical protein BFW01_g1669 [Lasiodiplodia theobromae]|uniref:Uncharacterized protein n=1 Tax=Lasiodiplodia theobromae TaxID=45133 RepID=A0A5N5D4V1_9PEZI|nr:UBA TS-N domain-containing protein [Lasiodiplodia theobromae]KAB2572729.1 hypothetical protein DBV05_g8622 [Lasiodiplodia theobromae]KAF4537822.1 UBA TS-N domain-containing protein [Lasiodiplodia theobromae]KAF9641686.1 hypothetical protein BFW01_g1669 [Lasiodiplodia theobromae]